MSTMRFVGEGHHLPAGAQVHTQRDEYLIELDVSDFKEDELTVEALGLRVTVRGEQRDLSNGHEAFQLRERLEESFWLPDDADTDETKVVYKHGTLHIHAPRRGLGPRRLPIEHPSFRVNPDAEAS